ncbi:MAG: hypothetical protein ABR562_02410 [Thermoplasmatota archaeon]
MATAKERQGQHSIWLWSGAALGGGAALWLAGWGVLQFLVPGWVKNWHALWALAGVSLLGATVLPFPGGTAALLGALRENLLLGAAGVLGTAIGGTVGAGLLLGLGDAGRAWLHKRANRGRWRKAFLRWSERFVKHWTYAAVAVLLVPFFIPRVVILYLAVILRLRALPFLGAVFAGDVGPQCTVLLGHPDRCSPVGRVKRRQTARWGDVWD